MIAIVGGGISGLAVAHGLKRRGVPFTLYEGSDEPGGVMRTILVDGVPLDVGPQRMRLTTEVAELVESAGLEGEMIRADPTLPLWVYRDGRLRRVPFGLREALGSDLLSLSGKLRILLEPLTRGLDPDETVADFFSRKFGREAYEAMIGPLYGGLYASDPANMYARHGLRVTLEHFGAGGSLLFALIKRGRAARRRIETISFREGLQALPRALAAADAINIRMRTPVRSLERAGSGWRVQIAKVDGVDTESVEAEAVVLCCPAEEAARLLEASAAEVACRIGELTTNRLAVVHLRSDFRGEGFGYQVAFGESLETRGVTWNASIFGRTGVYTAYLGGMGHPELVQWEDRRIGEVAAREFETVTEQPAEVLHVSRTVMPAWDATWDALEGMAMPNGLMLCSNWSARPGVPGRAVQAQRVVEALTKEYRP